MKYFTNRMTLDEVKKVYRQNALKFHPDLGGTDEAMQELIAEFEIAFAIAKRNGSVRTTETASSVQRDFYTQNGWRGSRYKTGLTTKDIAKIVRNYIKQVYPTYRFSVTSSYSTIDIALMEYPIELLNEALTENKKEAYTQYLLKREHQLNHYCISKDDWINPIILEVLEDINNLLNSYRYDDSNAMIDYFDTNFYPSISIGKWNKPAKFVERTARINTSKGTHFKQLSA